MSSRTQNLEGIILKRTNLGETDRLVTLISQEKGRFVCVAKGVRRLNSSTKAALEPGNIARVQLINTKGLPLLVQAKLLEDASPARMDLIRIRQLAQILEIFDKLFVEEEIPQKTYDLLLTIRQKLIQNETQVIRHYLQKLLQTLGFKDENNNSKQTMLEYVQQIAERPMRSFDFLQIKNHKNNK